MDIQLNWTTCFAVAGYVVANPGVRQALAWTGRAALTVNWKRMSVPAVVVLVFLAMLAESPVMAQSRRVRQSTSKAAGTDPSLAVAVATFNGTLKAVTKKEVTVDLDSGNTVEFRLSKKTEFYLGGKKAALNDLATEATVKIEGNKDGFGYLTATKITVKQETP